MSQRDELTKRRHAAVEEFLQSNADLFGITSVDDVGDGPFVLTEWCLVLHLRDLSVDDDSGEPNQVRAAFFRPGMGFSHKLGLIECLHDGLVYPREVDDDE